jgi:hypothetical protein
MKRVQNQEDRVGLGRARHLALQHVYRDACILRIGIQAIDARQVDQREVVAAHSRHRAHALFHGHARIVCHLLAQACQAIEKRRFVGIGRTDQDHRPQRTCRWRVDG